MFLTRPKWLILTALICLIASIVVPFVRVTNLFTTLHPHHYEQCRVVHGPIGAEDIALDARGVTFISSDARDWVPKMSVDGLTGPDAAKMKMAFLGPEDQGSIWAYDSRSPSKSRHAGEIVKLEIMGGLPESIRDFHPHGIAIPRMSAQDFADRPSTTPDEDTIEALEGRYLYVVNHARTGDEVIVFSIHYPDAKLMKDTVEDHFPPKLHFEAVLRHPLMTTLNDLEVLYPYTHPRGDHSVVHSFYASNFLGSILGDSLWNAIEMMTGRAWGSVILCQATQPGPPQQPLKHSIGKPDLRRQQPETSCTTVLPNLPGPNGLALSEDQTALYVALSTGKAIQTYELPPSASTHPTKASDHEWRHGSLRLSPLNLVDTIPLSTLPDNLSLDRLSGDIYIGSHPKLLAVSAHQEDPSRPPTPSQALRVTPRGKARLTKRTQEKNAKSPPEVVPINPALNLLRNKYGLAVTEAPANLVDEIHLSLGEKFGGTSVAVFNRPTKEIIMGGVSLDGLFICPYPAKDQIAQNEKDRPIPKNTVPQKPEL